MWLVHWQFWALLSAFFAAMTAIFAKLGVTAINPDFATFVRTLVVVVVLGGTLSVFGEWQAPGAISLRGYLFLILSGLATGASWLCYFRALSLGQASRVAPLDKLSVILTGLFAFAFLGEKLSLLQWIGLIMIGLGAALLAF